MKKPLLPQILLVIISIFLVVSCKKKSPEDIENEKTFDSTVIASFFEKHPKLKEFKPEVEKLYQKHTYHYIWFDRRGINEVADLLYDKINNLEEEGIAANIPYKAEFDAEIEKAEDSKPNPQTEVLISALYFFYADKVFRGVDANQSQELGWYLPRKKMSYVNYLDSLLIKPTLMNKDEKEVMGQYYRLREVLQRYREIEKKGGWVKIDVSEKMRPIKPGESSPTIAQIRTRLVATSDLKSDSKSAVYDNELEDAIQVYQKRMNANPDRAINAALIADMNVSVAQRIRTITVNMERCRWISANLTKKEEYIVINIPAYRLSYFKDNKLALASNVVVGKALNKTVVFSGMMKFIVFSPYWNVPKSIVKKEIEPGIAENSSYLEDHDMERDGENIRQRPGPKNSLGLVKFLFPNSNNIYLHDTPAKSLFNKEDRAFSHGCIRVEKVKELAKLILEDDKKWSSEKIDAAMQKGTEQWVTLKNKIPVYIGYFTAWVDRDGSVQFYDDIYSRDEPLAEMIYEN